MRNAAPLMAMFLAAVASESTDDSRPTATHPNRRPPRMPTPEEMEYESNRRREEAERVEAIAAKLRAENKARRIANYMKRQPKGKA